VVNAPAPMQTIYSLNFSLPDPWPTLVHAQSLSTRTYSMPAALVIWSELVSWVHESGMMDSWIPQKWRVQRRRCHQWPSCCNQWVRRSSGLQWVRCHWELLGPWRRSHHRQQSPCAECQTVLVVHTDTGHLLGEDGSGNSDESSVNRARPIRSLERVFRGQDRDGGASGDVLWVVGRSHEHWESLDGQGRVVFRAWDDERRSQGINLVEVKRDIKWRWERALAERVADVRGVSWLDSQNAASGGEVVLRHDISSRAQICADTDTLEDGCGREERLDARDTEVVGALFDGRCASLGDSSSQKADMGHLVCWHLHDVGADGGIEASSREVRRAEVVETFTIEFVLKMF